MITNPLVDNGPGEHIICVKCWKSSKIKLKDGTATSVSTQGVIMYFACEIQQQEAMLITSQSYPISTKI